MLNKKNFKSQQLADSSHQLNTILSMKEALIKINNLQEKANLKTQMVSMKEIFLKGKNKGREFIFFTTNWSTSDSTNTIKNKATANFTTVMKPWPTKAFGKITFPMEKAIHMARITSLLSWNLSKESAPS